ncbi:MAG: hypothetical protein JWO76_2661 [Nocardioides sp.]|nr:hypothetical protein [Nocardioides sp.]
MHTLPRTRLAALAAAALTASLLAGCGGDDDDKAADPTPAGSSTKKPPKSTPTDAGSEPTGTPSGTADQVTVPVYFVGDTPQGPRLYREFRKVGADDPLDAAAALVTGGDALDPDYRTLYPGGAFAGITHDDGGFSVELADDGWSTPAEGMSKSDAKLAVQQLVYTIQGVEQSRDPVTFYLGGDPVTIFGIDSSGGIENAPQLDVAAFVNLTTPEEGASVSGSFKASGVASSFEATVPWQIRRGDSVVKKGFATAEGWLDKLYPFETEVDVSDLDPGEYTFVAMTDDPSGGEGGGPNEDSKTIIVR